MKKLFAIVLFLTAFGFSQSSVSYDYMQSKLRFIVGGGKISPNVGMENRSDSIKGSFQYGFLNDPGFSNASLGAVGIYNAPRLHAGSGHIPYYYGFVSYPLTLGAGSGVVRQVMFKGLDCTASDSGCHQAEFGKGSSWFTDSIMAQGKMVYANSVTFHGVSISTNRIIGDSDNVLIGDNGSHALSDTLVFGATAIGRHIWLIQNTSPAAGNWVIHAHSGNTIGGYDSLVLRSNKGVSSAELICVGSTWIVLERHEEGIFTATLTGVSGTVSDTGTYKMDNITHFFIRIPTLVGTSTSTSLGITGFPSQITLTSMTDSTKRVTAPGLRAYDTGNPVGGICVMLPNGTDASCAKIALTLGNWTGTGTKGLPDGVTFEYDLPRQATY